MKAKKNTGARAGNSTHSTKQNDSIGQVSVARHHITLSFTDGSRLRLSRKDTATLRQHAKALKTDVGSYVVKLVQTGLEKKLREIRGGAS